MTARTFFKRLGIRLYNDNVLDVAAMMAFYAVLALFPMMLFVVTLAALVIPVEAITEAVAMAPIAMPRTSALLIGEQVTRLQQNQGTGAWFLISTAGLALWAASRGISALITSLDAIIAVPETRPWIRRQWFSVVMTLIVAVLAIVAMALLIAGPLVGHWIMDRWGLGATFDAVWTGARWSGAGVLAMVLFVLLYRYLPNRTAKLVDMVPGAAVAVVLWLLVSRGFGLYVEAAGSYDLTYGTASTVVVFLLWLWLSNLALLVGAEVNQVLAEGRAAALDAGRLAGLDRAQRVEEQVELPGGDLRR